MYHPILERQIKKYFQNERPSKDLTPFLKAISDAYTHADEDQHLLERSLDISSEELRDINHHLTKEKNQLLNRTDQLETINKVMINRELKMIELKKTIDRLSVNKSTD